MGNGREPERPLDPSGTGGRSDCWPLGGDFLPLRGSEGPAFPQGAPREVRVLSAVTRPKCHPGAGNPASQASSSPAFCQAG